MLVCSWYLDRDIITITEAVRLTASAYDYDYEDVAGPRAWNNLPVDLRLSRTFTIFKTHLKSHLFNLFFPSV